MAPSSPRVRASRVAAAARGHPNDQLTNNYWLLPRPTEVMTSMRTGFIAALVLASATSVVAQQPVASGAGPTLIRNATVLTVTKGTLQNTDVLLQNGKIAQIGRNLATPAGAKVIDATGKFILPGIIDPHS